MKIPPIKKQDALLVAAGVSKLSKVEFERIPHPALLKEPAQFWDEIFIANEAYMLEGITHPRIRKKLAYDAASHRLFLEYVEAETLHDLVQADVPRKDPRRIHHLLQSVAETLADLHAGILCGRPIVHNDVKSMNVLVAKASPRESLLIDFSHSYYKDNLPPFIMDGSRNLIGTAKSMAPEKWDRDFTRGFESDTFAFGVLAYYAHTGRHPFEGDAAQIERQIREATPASPLELGVEILRSTVATMMLCLEKNPNRRPSMEQVAQSYEASSHLFN